MDGIRGEVKVPGYVGWIRVDAIIQGESNSASYSTGSGGMGKVSVSTYRFIKPFDAASPVLFRFCAEGHHINSAELHALHSGKVIIGVTFDEALITDFNPSAGPCESFQISFRQMRVSYQKEPLSKHVQNPGWSVKTARKV